MALQWQTFTEKLTKRYDAALMWFSSACLAGSVIWVIISWSMTESVGTFNERLTVIGEKIKSGAKAPESIAGAYQRIIDYGEGYSLTRQDYKRMIFAKYKEPIEDAPVIVDNTVPETPPENEPTDKGPRFVLTKTTQEPLPLLWSGELRSEQGLVLYQVNTPTGTHFLREDGEINGYKIIAFEDGKLKVQKVIDHEVFYLEYKKQSMEKELFAEILDAQSQQTQTVHVGSTIGEYTVVEITDSLARLKDTDLDQTLVLELNTSGPEAPLDPGGVAQ